MRWLALIAVAVAGCGEEAGDMGVVADGAPAPRDLAVPRDLATAPDLATPDLAVAADLAMPDLATPDVAVARDFAGCHLVRVSPPSVETCAAKTTFTVANDCDGDAQVTAVDLSGANANDFALFGVPVLPVTVAGGGSFSFEIDLAKNALGLRSAQLDVAGSENVSVPISASNGPVLATDVGQVHFGNQPVNTLSPAQFIKVTDVAACDLHMISVAAMGANPNDFPLDANGLPATLTPGASGTLQVQFAPTAAGQRSALLVFSSDDLQQHAVAVSGTGF